MLLLVLLTQHVKNPTWPPPVDHESEGSDDLFIRALHSLVDASSLGITRSDTRDAENTLCTFYIRTVCCLNHSESKAAGKRAQKKG